MGSDSGRYFYAVGLAFALGILADSFLNIDLPEIAFLILIGVGVGVVQQRGLKPSAGLVLFTVSILAFSLGLLRMDYTESRSADPYLESLLGTEVTMEGVVKREPEERDTTTHLYIKTEHGLILVTAPVGDDWNYGDGVTFTGELKKPESFETDLGRTFNYPGYLLARGVSYTVRQAEVELLNSSEGSAFISAIFDLKHRFMDRIELLLPEPAAGLGEGLLLGVKKALGEELETVFRETGIIHIVVLSGYNIMIVVYFILFVLGSVFGRRWSTIFGVAGIAVFAIMVGLGASVVRASIMAALLLLLNLTGHIYLILRGLLLAGVVMLLINPYSLAFDVGFQLSFLATLGLIFVAPHLDERLQNIPNRWLSAREFLVATLATQIFVLPLLLYQTGEFSVVAVIVNVLVLPMVPIAMLLTFLTGLVGLLSLSLSAPLAYVTYLSLSYVILMAEWFASLPFAAFTVPPFPFWYVPFGYLFLGLIIWRLQCRSSLSG